MANVYTRTEGGVSRGRRAGEGGQGKDGRGKRAGERGQGKEGRGKRAGEIGWEGSCGLDRAGGTVF